MEDTRHEEFNLRTTVWPGVTVPVPRVSVRESVDLEEEEFLLFNGDSKFIEIPDELYLRELRVMDLADVEQIVDFSKKYGKLGSENWYDLTNGHELSPYLKKIDQRVKRNKKLLKPLDGQDLFHIDEFRVHAALLRDMSRAWEMHRGQISYSEFKEGIESGSLRQIVLEGIPDVANPPDKYQAFIIIFYGLNMGLHPFRVRVENPIPPNGVHPPEILNFGGPLPSLYSVLCLQLSNHVNEYAEYKHCQNETCNELFVRQRGRAKYGYYKTKGDIYYCSSQCAKAQVQRELRRRKAKARKLHKKGVKPQEIAGRVGANLEAVKRWITK
ncbi:MAG: hypothetical protein ACYC6Z_05660 [Thermoleophilia bacterium]